MAIAAYVWLGLLQSQAHLIGGPMQKIEIPLEPLSDEAFAVYGWILKGTGAPDFSEPRLKNWRLPFSSEDALRLQIMRYSQQEMRLSMFERHINVTEARHPIGPAAAVLVVADEAPDRDMPDINAVRAFYLDGTHGIMFRKGIWHGLDCYPARTPYVDYLFLSDAATEDEIESLPNPASGTHTHVYDFAPHGTKFQIIDPQGLTA